MKVTILFDALDRNNERIAVYLAKKNGVAL
jgi:hypothetical protein